jgi:hypothetical protein
MTDEELTAFMKKNGIEGAEPMPSRPRPATLHEQFLAEANAQAAPLGLEVTADGGVYRTAPRKPRIPILTLPNGNAVLAANVVKIGLRETQAAPRTWRVWVLMADMNQNESFEFAEEAEAEAVRDDQIRRWEDALA